MVADTALTARRDAMNDALKDVTNGDKLAIDFYDRTRIATWVRSHAGLIPYVRELVGGALRLRRTSNYEFPVPEFLFLHPRVKEASQSRPNFQRAGPSQYR